MKVLIIGGNGFIGRCLAYKCITLGWDVTCIVNRFKEFIPFGCNIINISDLDQLIDEYNFIFLLAAYIPYNNLNKPEQKLIKTNIELPLKVISIFPNAKIIYSSSISVYGTHANIINELSTFNNPNLYGLSKISAETIVRIHNNYSIIRFSSVFGPFMNESSFIPKILNSAIKQNKITIIGDGKRKQNYLFVEDAAEYCINAAIKGKNSIYLGVGNKSISNIEVAQIIKSFLPKCEILFSGTDYEPSFIFDNSFTRNELNFEPNISFENGINILLKNE